MKLIQQKQVPNNTDGFTLIELLLVLATISIIILISPSLKFSQLENIEQDQFLFTFQSDILYLQNLSTTTEDYVRIRLYPDKYKVQKGQKTLYTRHFPKGLEIDHRSNQTIFFKKSGSIVNRKALKVTTNKAEYEIVFPLGKGSIYIVEK